ncbi:hypothetical protein [Membranihabitans maritimus]|uniref:hypothetical protein n=1 Tax=Membranihabitans maritimus TaxID=2904244 RepID=UPI001F49273E|nr:hypothetical protein [Membranihabitans maritimus]
MKEITATVVFNHFEGGFWGLIDKDKNKYVPVNMPEQLKVEGKTSVIVISERPDVTGIQMWGAYVEIISFNT